MADSIKLSRRARLIRLGLALAAAAVMAGCMAVAGFLMQGVWVYGLTPSITVSAGFLTANFIIALGMLMRLTRISAWNMSQQILPVWFTLTVIALVLLLGLRLDYSNVFFAVNWLAGLALLAGFAHAAGRLTPLRVGVVTGADLPDGDYINVGLDDTNEAIDVLVMPEKEIADNAMRLTGYVMAGIAIIPDHVFREHLTGRVDLTALDAAALMELRPLRRYGVVKRLSDMVMAVAGIVVLAPLMVIIAILIPLESRGSPVFVQTRIGQGGRPFRLYKFRSMRAGESSAARFASRDDKRITRIGKIIRTTRLDETPQLFNVLAGSMSIIGPRPEQQDLVDDLASRIPLYGFRHVIRPGITGWAQVMQGYADDVASTDVKLSYDIFYIKNLSLTMDLVIFFKTLKTVITGFGSR